MPQFIRILSIDGGGIRGILPGQILISLEEKVKKKSGNSDARLVDYFDLFAGTSTGGILTCLYNTPGFSASDAVGLYLQHGTAIFTKTFKKKLSSFFGITDEAFDVLNLENCLKKYFGNSMLSSSVKHSIITSYDIVNRRPHFFRPRKARGDADFDFPLWQVCRGTSAAPTYFEPALVQSKAGNKYPVVDGGVFANNPTLCAYAEARQIFESMREERRVAGKKVSASEMLILSVGTGTVKVPYSYETAREWGLAGWVRPVLDIMMSGVSDTVDFQLKQIFDAVGKPENYVRLIPDLAGVNPEMSDASPGNMEALRIAGIKAAEKFDAELEKVAAALISDASGENISV